MSHWSLFNSLPALQMSAAQHTPAKQNVKSVQNMKKSLHEPHEPHDQTAPLAPDPVDRSLCASTARLLAAVAGAAGALGLGCMLVGAVALGALAWRVSTLQANQEPSEALLALCAVMGVVLVLLERSLALRLQFDAGLFADLALSGATLDSLRALDQALHTLGLRHAGAVVRPLLDRVRGAQRLARWHVATVALQVLGLLGLYFGAWAVLWAGTGTGIWTGALPGWGTA